MWVLSVGVRVMSVDLGVSVRVRMMSVGVKCEGAECSGACGCECVSVMGDECECGWVMSVKVRVGVNVGG